MKRILIALFLLIGCTEKTTYFNVQKVSVEKITLDKHYILNNRNKIFEKDSIVNETYFFGNNVNGCSFEKDTLLLNEYKRNNKYIKRIKIITCNELE